MRQLPTPRFAWFSDLCPWLCILLVTASLKADPCSPNWGGDFDLDNGVSGTVRAVAVFDDGTGPAIYVGGQFTGTGGIPANNIARWDGGTWKPLGAGLQNGVDNTVWTMTVHDDGTGPALYVGGEFDNAGDLSVNHIAKWDGLAWMPLSSGTNGGVYALAEHDDGTGKALYIGGSFTQADGIVVNRIARWHADAFTAVGGGVTGSLAPPAMVRALASFDCGTGPQLYAGGQFTSPGKNIAVWNGSTWSTLAYAATFGTSNLVNSMVVFNDGNGDDLYVAGAFTSTGDSSHNCVNCKRVARWDGTGWSALDTGFGDKEVNALAVFDDGQGAALHATGTFSKSGGSSNPAALQRIARWNPGTPGNWSPVDEGLPDDTRNPCWCGLADCACGPRPAVGWALAAYNDGLYVGGDFVFVPTDATCLEAFNLVRRGCIATDSSQADLDLDNDVDLHDFDLFVECFTGPNLGPLTTCCGKADFDGDTDVDQDDFGVYQRCFAGPGIPPPAGCDR